MRGDFATVDLGLHCGPTMFIFLAVWVFSIPLLGLIALVVWFKKLRSDLPLWRSALGFISVVAVGANWALFLFLAYCGQIGGFGTHYMTTQSADRYLMVAVAAIPASFAFKGESRILGLLSAFLMFALWGGSEMVA
jgi:hypothetical protein